MQHPQAPGAQILQRVGHGVQLARLRAVQRDGERVDREVAPLQVIGQRCRLHLGQCPRDGVALAASGGDVDPAPLLLPLFIRLPLCTPFALLVARPLHGRGAEALVLVHGGAGAQA